MATDLDGDLGPDAWPRTVDAAVDMALKRLPPAGQAKLRAMKRDDLIALHHGYGAALRHRFGLWRANDELLESACGLAGHPDDAAMVIIEAIWQRLQPQ